MRTNLQSIKSWGFKCFQKRSLKQSEDEPQTMLHVFEFKTKQELSSRNHIVYFIKYSEVGQMLWLKDVIH